MEPHHNRSTIQSPYLTLAEAAVYLRRSPAALRALLSRGRLRSDGRGPRGTHLFRIATLEHFVKAGSRMYPDRGQCASPGCHHEHEEHNGKTKDPISGGHSIRKQPIPSPSELDVQEDRLTEEHQAGGHGRKPGRSQRYQVRTTRRGQSRGGKQASNAGGGLRALVAAQQADDS